MAVQQSDVSVNNANQIIGLVQQMKSLRAAIADLLVVNTNNPLGTLFNAMPTTVLNADGTLGTADGTPTSGHYVDPRAAANINISRVVKNTDLTNGLQAVVNLNSFLAGQAVAANASMPQFLDALGM